ncbi:MAG: heavy-metal-associated domain-containing protein, partial [Chloroflexota bacterium]
LCCATPVLLVVLGLATSSLVVAWLNLKPIFFALAAVFLVAGVAITLRRSRQECSVRGYRRRLWLYPLVTVVAFGAGYWMLMDVATPRLYSQVYASDQSKIAHSGTVLEPNGQVVALRRATFKIYMGCEGCASTLRTVFLGLPGVHAAAINIHNKTATALYDPTRINAMTIKSKIPYPWYYTPHLSSDVAMAMTAASNSPTVEGGTLMVLLAAIAGLLGLTSAAVWTTGRRIPQ